MKLNVDNNKSNEKIIKKDNSNFTIKNSFYNIITCLIYIASLLLLAYILYKKEKLNEYFIVAFVLTLIFFLYQLLDAIVSKAVFTDKFVEITNAFGIKKRIDIKDINEITEGTLFSHYYILDSTKKIPIFKMFNKKTRSLVQDWCYRRRIKFK